jgi:hypothetical protein
MSSKDQYRLNAEDCLYRAKAAQDERDVPLWVTLAQSWLRLAEHADRVTEDLRSAGTLHAEESEPEAVPN